MSKTTLFDSRIKKYAYREAAQLYGELGSSPAGLSPEQVERQQEKYCSNCFGSRSSDTMLRRLRRAFIARALGSAAASLHSSLQMSGAVSSPSALAMVSTALEPVRHKHGP